MKTPRLVLIALFLARSVPATSADSAKLEGIVTDEAGVALSAVGVTLDGRTPGSARATTTDAAGRFEWTGVSPGLYSISFRLPGFATTVRSVTLEPGAVARVDASLRMAFAADVLVTSRRTFRTLTDLDEPVNGLVGLANAAPKASWRRG